LVASDQTSIPAIYLCVLLVHNLKDLHHISLCFPVHTLKDYGYYDYDDNDDNDNDLTFGFVCCQLFLIKFCVYSVYIGWVRARIPSPPTAHKKPRAPLPQHSTLSLRNSGHDHHNDHDDMVTITMMIMMSWSWWWSSWRYSPICSSPPPWKKYTIYYILCTIFYILCTILYNIQYILHTIYYILWRRPHCGHEVVSCTFACPPSQPTLYYASVNDDDDHVDPNPAGPMFVIVDVNDDE
jgi:hypothetical protein